MIFFKIFEPLGADFVVYHEAAQMFLSGLNPYHGLFTRTFPFNYPPPALLFIFPLGFFNHYWGSLVWNIFSTLSLLAAIILMGKITNLPRKLYPVILILFTVFFFPVKFNIGNGQINNFLLLFCVLALYFYKESRKNLSALFLAFATGIKFAPAIFVLYFLIKKDWLQVGRFLFWLAVVFTLPMIFIPISFQFGYFFKVLPLSFTTGAKDWYYNQSLWGFLARSFLNQSFVAMLFYPLAVLILLMTVLKASRSFWKRGLAAISCLYLLIHPIALQHYFGFTIIPLILLGSQAKGKDWLVLALAYVLLAVDIKNFNQVPRELNFVLSHDFYGVLALWLFALWPEKFWQIVSFLWVFAITSAYILMLLCRAKTCL